MRVLSVIYLIMFFKTAAMAAVQSENIASIYHGGTPFMVVTPSTISASNPVTSPSLQTGIYKKEQGQWQLFFPGEILVDDRKGPFVYQLGVTKLDDRYTSLLIIDGKLNLITANTDHNDPTTFLTIGSPEFPLYEIQTMNKRYLPPITHPNQVSIYQFESALDRNGSQLVLVSVKFSTPSPIGDAMTFVIGVKPNRNNKEVELYGKPIVIDYQFHDPLDLQRLKTLGTGGESRIFSRLLYDEVLREDPTQYKGHSAIIQKGLQYLKKFTEDTKNQSNINAYLSFNFTSQKVEGQTILSEKRNEAYFTFTQIYDLKKSAHNLHIEGKNTFFDMPGMIDAFNDAQSNWKFWTSDSSPWSTIFLKDGVLHYIELSQGRSNQYKFIHKELGTLNSLFGENSSNFPIDRPEDFHFTTFTQENNGQVDLAIVLSVGNSTLLQGFTGLIRLKLYENEAYISRGAFRISSFFIPPEMLIARLNHKNDVLLYDVVTPEMSTQGAYYQAYDQSKPHLSLFETNVKTGPAYRYNHPSKQIAIIDGISYASFSRVDGIPNPSGLYFANKDQDQVTGNETQRILGQLLVKQQSPDDKTTDQPQYLARFELSHNRANEEARDDEYQHPIDARELYVFAVDAANEGGRRGYTLVIASNSGSATNRFKYQSISLANNGGDFIDFADLRDISFVRGRQRSSPMVSIVFSFRNKANKEAMAYINVDLRTIDGLNPKFVNLLDHSISTKELGDRLAYNETGAPYLVLTPELAEDSVNLTMHSFLENKVIYPNQDYGTKRTSFKIGTKLSSDSVYNVPYKDSWRSYGTDLEKSLDVNRVKEVAEFESFVDLRQQIDSLANPEKPPERLVLVVPQSLRNLVWDFIIGTYTSKDMSQAPKFFHRFNSKLNLNIFDPQKSSQEQFFENIKSMARSRDIEERSLFMARLDELYKSKMPQNRSGNPFLIYDVESHDGSDLTNVGAHKQSKLPHAMYLLAAGGPLSLEDFRKSPPAAPFSTIILATPEELAQLDKDARSEIDYGMMNSFRIKEIRNPDQESMAVSIERIFETPEVKSLDYKFSGKEIRPRLSLQENENLSVIVDYAISRFNALVEQKRQSLFESFMRFRAAFAAAVVTDRQIRQSRVINKFFVERVLNQVFDIPINLETLPPDDPIRLLSRKDAVLKLQEAGYSGPFDLKTKVIRTVLSQTLADAGKPIPSSTILFGETGAGKTFMFVSLIKMLGLQLYDFSGNTDNSNASAIIINIGKVIEDVGGRNETSALTASKVIYHLNAFLSGNNGYRGWILIDDVHAASDKVKAEILSWLRGTFEAPGGMYLTSSGVRRPIRNLNIFMTLNPTADQEQIGRFAKDKSKPSTEELLLATLSTSQFKVEPSFLRRWNSIINLNYMPVGAKGPELIKSLAEASKNLLNSHSKIALVDPSIVRRLVSENEKLDARTFLSASTNALIDMAARSEVPGAVSLIVPSMNSNPKINGPGYAMDGSHGERIDNWVNSYSRPLALDSSLDGNLALMQLVVNAFRTPVYEFLISALQEDVRFSGDHQNQKSVLAPILAAISDHLSNHPDLPLFELPLKPSEFGLTTHGQREGFNRAMEAFAINRDRPYFPINFGRTGENTSWQDLYNSGAEGAAKSSHNNVIADAIAVNHGIVEKHLQSVLKVNDLDQLPDTFNWLMHLTPGDQQQLKKVGKDLANGLWTYLPQMFDENLTPLKGRNSSEPMSVYGATRLYLYSIDKSITQLPWVKTNRFILHALELITQDQVLSQKSGVQNFLFTDRYRLLKPTITDLAFQMIANSPVVETIPTKTRANLRARFADDCESYLTPPQGN